ncbi:MAG: cytochrome c [Gammaproteobacteria bacterium]|nr:MAG: cytochrome c [Gammaproteobacteria bacterium]
MKTRLVVFAAGMMASIALSAHAGGDPVAGKQKAAACQACHGMDGIGVTPQFPTLAGQFPDYLVRALSDYKSGQRKNAIMAGFAANLTPQDMEDLASFYASRKNGLYVKQAPGMR